MKYIVTNFAYGTGPYLRTTELAIAFNDELEKRGKPRFKVIIPFVYGKRQQQVMREEFSEHDRRYPGELLLDAALGEMLGSMFYAKGTYEASLSRWIKEIPAISRQIRDHLGGKFEVESLGGNKEMVHGKDIVLELNRSPRVAYGLPSYSATFAFTGEILDQASQEPEGTFAVSRNLFLEGKKIADEIEESQKLTCLTYPATFSYEPGYTVHHRAALIPPTLGPVQRLSGHVGIKEGIYVTVTGIPGLERLYREAHELGLTLYSNDQESVPGSVHALPQMITRPEIKLHFARSGWSSVWYSMFAGSPLVVPDFDPTDDPEIYFNNQAVEKLGIGIVYRGEPLFEIMKKAETVRERQKDLVVDIEKRFGTLGGTEIAARRFADDFLRTQNV
ncbi:MAG: hypothetical protein AAB518_02900 [Patescibacteria group bacterium]